MGETTTLLTFAEFEQLPDDALKRELVRGHLIEMPPAQKVHHRIARRLQRRLDDWVSAGCELGAAGTI
jgi:Uma2 family endonuclease